MSLKSSTANCVNPDALVVMVSLFFQNIQLDAWEEKNVENDD